ncbi:MAG: hypothetical protein Q9171_005012 [Xanthocarpia ochracea]
MKHLTLNPSTALPPTRDHPQSKTVPDSLPHAKQIKTHPKSEGSDDENNASLLFVGTATTILDHFDDHVESSLRRDLPIITTPHAKSHLTSKGEGEAFTAVHDLDFFEDILVDIEGGEGKGKAAVKVMGMPGKHVPPGVLGTLNDLVNAVPPTNGWMIELGYKSDEDFKCGYRIYISGDTLLVDELKEIPKRYAGKNIDLMLIHLGGTTIPSPSVPLLMVTMDAEQGLGLVKLIDPDLTIPIHYDDYDVFLSPLEDFKKKMEEAGLQDKVVYLDRNDKYNFKVKR